MRGRLCHEPQIRAGAIPRRDDGLDLGVWCRGCGDHLELRQAAGTHCADGPAAWWQQVSSGLAADAQPRPPRNRAPGAFCRPAGLTKNL